MTAPAVTWARAYRPLRPPGLVLQLALLAGAELLLFASYRGHEASFHWASHFLVGMTAAALWNLSWLVLKGAPARGQLLSILAFHLVAMFPDLLFSAGIAHYPWMDVFLAHISSHYVPGGTTTWLFVALTASALYAIVLSGWLRARAEEADAGLAPGIGIGGAAVVRAQASPRTSMLAHTRYGPDRPPDALLLHGLGASRALWAPVATELESRGRAVLVPDLLGFGASRRLGTEFRLADHVLAVRRLAEGYGGAPLVVCGHSFGCAVAVALAQAAPVLVRELVLVSPPVFRDAARARQRLAERGWLARQVVRGSPVASVACGLMCAARAPAGHLVARFARDLPERVARDSVQHSWPAYRDALGALLEANPLPQAIERPQRPTTVVLTDRDEQAPAEDVLAWRHDAVDLIELPGDHLLPLRDPAVIAALIASHAGRDVAARPGDG